MEWGNIMTESMMKRIEQMKALEAKMNEMEAAGNQSSNLYYDSAYTTQEISNLGQDLQQFQDTTDLYEVEISEENLIKYA